MSFQVGEGWVRNGVRSVWTLVVSTYTFLQSCVLHDPVRTRVGAVSKQFQGSETYTLRTLGSYGLDGPPEPSVPTWTEIHPPIVHYYHDEDLRSPRHISSPVM